MSRFELRTLSADWPHAFLETDAGPHLSLYQPTHRNHPDAREDPIRFKNLVRQLEASLAEVVPSSQINEWLAPFRELQDDGPFWGHNLDGLAVFAEEGRARVYRLRHAPPERAVVTGGYHVKPLLRSLQAADRFLVLALDRERVRLFEGDRHGLDEMPLHQDVPATITDALGEELTEPHLEVGSYGAPGGQGPGMHHGHGGRKDDLDVDTRRWFQAVDRAISEHHSKPSGLPLLLAALPEYQGAYREISHDPQLIDASVEAHPDSLDRDALRDRAWEALRPTYEAQLAAVAERFGQEEANGKGSRDPDAIAEAVINGRVATLLLEEGRFEAGRVHDDGRIERLDAASDDPGVHDDLFDDLAERVLSLGGRVWVVEADRMPSDTGVAAIYRY